MDTKRKGNITEMETMLAFMKLGYNVLTPVAVIVGKRESRSGSLNNQIWVDMRSWRTHLTVNQAH